MWMATVNVQRARNCTDYEVHDLVRVMERVSQPHRHLSCVAENLSYLGEFIFLLLNVAAILSDLAR